MSVIVGEGAQAVELFLAGRIPEGELDVDVIDEDIVDVVFEDGGFVDGGKVAAVARGASDKLGWGLVRYGEAHPLVKTLSSEVLPQAPSPLF